MEKLTELIERLKEPMRVNEKHLNCPKDLRCISVNEMDVERIIEVLEEKQIRDTDLDFNPYGKLKTFKIEDRSHEIQINDGLDDY